MAVLKSGDFSFELIFSGNKLHVNVAGLQYSGKHMLYCGVSEYKKFVKNLEDLYKTLKEGEARLQEFYEQDFISFESDGLGHFNISGEFNNWCHWNLKFEETVDQTYLKTFINQLKNDINKKI